MAEVNSNTTPQPAQPAPQAAKGCGCPTINPVEWDKQRKKLDKTFYKSFSPRLLYYPFSFSIDLDRATKSAAKKGYQVVPNGMILDTGGMFLGSVLIEVSGAKADDKNVISLSGKELYTKVSRRPFKEIKTDIAELETELGASPGELYIWWTSCPKCTAQKETKAVLIAVPGAAEGVGAKATQLFKKAVDKAGQAAEQVAAKAAQPKGATPSAQPETPPAPAQPAPTQPQPPAAPQPKQPAQPIATTPPKPEPPKQA